SSFSRMDAQMSWLVAHGFLLLIGKCFQVVRVLHLSAHMELVGRSWFSVSWFDELPHVSLCAAGVSSPLSSSHTSLASCAIGTMVIQKDRMIKRLDRQI